MIGLTLVLERQRDFYFDIGNAQRNLGGLPNGRR